VEFLGKRGNTARNNRHLCVTTSWDDGCPLDLRIMRLLEQYGLNGTFYVPIKNPDRSVMSKSDLLDLATLFEIGSHTYSHRVLPGLSSVEMKKEVTRGRDTLEQLLGRRVPCFCYPLGSFNQKAVQCLKEADVRAARTTQAFHTADIKSRFQWGTTLQAFPHTPAVHFRHGLKERNWSGLYNYLFQLHIASGWRELAVKLFDLVLHRGGVWHLWGHSWEIEKFGLWEDLEHVFEHVSGYPNASYLTNGQVIDYFFPE